MSFRYTLNQLLLDMRNKHSLIVYKKCRPGSKVKMLIIYLIKRREAIIGIIIIIIIREQLWWRKNLKLILIALIKKIFILKSRLSKLRWQSKRSGMSWILNNLSISLKIPPAWWRKFWVRSISTHLVGLMITIVTMKMASMVLEKRVLVFNCSLNTFNQILNGLLRVLIGLRKRRSIFLHRIAEAQS